MFISNFLPCCIFKGCCSNGIQTQRGISDVEEDTNEDIAPSAVEAVVIVFIENNQAKWEYLAEWSGPGSRKRLKLQGAPQG